MTRRLLYSYPWFDFACALFYNEKFFGGSNEDLMAITSFRLNTSTKVNLFENRWNPGLLIDMAERPGLLSLMTPWTELNTIVHMANLAPLFQYVYFQCRGFATSAGK